MSRITLVGGSGHAKVVLATAEAAGHEIAAVVDDDPARWGRTLLGHAVSGPCAEVLADPSARVVLAIGDNRGRARLAATARCQFATLVHPSAIVHASVVLGPGTVVFAGAAIQPDTRIGAHVIVNTAAAIDHDCELGDFVHLAPGVRLCGAVAVGAGGFLGVGVVAIPGVRIGAWATVGAGAAVVTDLAAGVVAVGVPARPRGG